MSNLSLEEIVKRVKEWQEYPYVHPLTCGNDSRHNDLIPIIQNEKVILKCLDCDYIQNYIPDFLLGESFKLIKIDDIIK